MKTPTKPGVTVILEDAYKQNTVYRPWQDITSGQRVDKTAIAAIKPGDPRLNRPASR